jgi:hypothetical protein
VVTLHRDPIEAAQVRVVRRRRLATRRGSWPTDQVFAQIDDLHRLAGAQAASEPGDTDELEFTSLLRVLAARAGAYDHLQELAARIEQETP